MVVILAALVVSALGFTLSASAGLGGSLIIVPALGALLGTKEGIALGALLLAANNVAKVVAYRRTIPFRIALGVVVLTIAGAAIGGRLLVDAPEGWVAPAVIASFIVALVFERRSLSRAQNVAAPVLAFGAGATSGFSGTSGPLKGMALRNLRQDRLHFVGAASLVSLANDATKSAIYSEADLIDGQGLIVLALALPLMPLATLTGRHINSQIGERAFTAIFWLVMVGYSLRIVWNL